MIGREGGGGLPGGGGAEAESDGGRDNDRVSLLQRSEATVYVLDINHLEPEWPASADYLDISKLLSRSSRCPLTTFPTTLFKLGFLCLFSQGWQLTGPLSEPKIHWHSEPAACWASIISHAWCETRNLRATQPIR